MKNGRKVFCNVKEKFSGIQLSKSWRLQKVKQKKVFFIAKFFSPKVSFLSLLYPSFIDARGREYFPNKFLSHTFTHITVYAHTWTHTHTHTHMDNLQRE